MLPEMPSRPVTRDEYVDRILTRWLSHDLAAPDDEGPDVVEERIMVMPLSGLWSLAPNQASGQRCGGRPNAGKIRSVSKKNVSRLSRPSHTSCTCSAQGW